MPDRSDSLRVSFQPDVARCRNPLLRLVLTAGALLWEAAPAVQAEWLRVSSPNFELFTDAGEKAGREVVGRLEQIRQVFRDIGGHWKTSPLPVRAYLFASGQEYQRYRPTPTSRGFFHGGLERNLIVMQALGAATARVAFHEYVHLVLNHTAAALPRWLEEGTAEFYSTARVAGRKVILGDPIDNHLRILSLRPWLSARELAAVTTESPIYTQPDRIGVFYAQSWALVHMLHFSVGLPERLPRYARLLSEGASAEESFREAFSRPLDSLLEDLKQYVAAGRWRRLEVDWEPPGETAIEIEPLTPSETRLAIVDLQMQLGLWDASEEELRKTVRRAGDSAQVETARGMLAMARRDFQKARAHFRAAIAAGSRQASTYYEYAMLLRETGGERQDIFRNLETAVHLNPTHADAWFLLGLLASNEGRHEDALEPLRRAAALRPRRSDFWHALALACRKTGRREEALLSARRALQAARTKQEVEMAEAALQLTGKREPGIELPGRPEVTTPSSWFRPQGDTRIEGALYRIDCLGASARIYIRTAGGDVALLVRDPATVELRNAPSATYEFACGRPPERNVAVEYTAAADPATGTAGVVSSIEFR